MFFFFGKNKEQSEEVKKIITFNNDFENLLKIDAYISKKECFFLIDNYDDLYNYFKTINNSSLLKSYAKKNSVDSKVILDFLNKYENLYNIVSRRNDLFIQDKLRLEKIYLDNILKEVDPKILLDDDQRKVILTDEDYCLVIAGAGAGKTTTVAAKVKYLVEKKYVDPKQILIISFTNKAVGELREKINRDLNIDCPITTFHSAGNAILRKKTDEKLNIVEGGFLYNSVRDYFVNMIKDKRAADNIILFFGSYFETQYEGSNKDEYLNHIVKSDYSTMKSNLNEYQYQATINKKKVTLNNEVVSSVQELKIANFLYLNGIEYEYEPNYPYHIFMSRKRYTPDFLIKQNGREIYLEHFGVSESGQNTRFTQEELQKYKKSIIDKINIHKKHNTNLIYTFSEYNDGIELIEHLKEILIKNNIQMNPKPSEEVLEKLTKIQENKYVSKMVFLICDFISNFKVNGYTEEKFYEFIRTTKSERTKLFLEICRECYLEYQKNLVKVNAVDFQDMINEAARALREVESLKQKLDFKYIIIDEYQDISRQRFDMAKELSKVTDSKIIAVGDDWQSIFAFSGSDVTLFTKFCEKMGYGAELKITRTYRNAQEVIDIAGGFIQKNDAQIKKSLISPKHIEDPVIVVSYDDSPKKYDETAKDAGPLHKMAEALEFAISEIINHTGKDSNILLIGRYNYDGENLSKTGKFSYDTKGSKVISKKYPSANITFLTAHSSKGLGYDNVIIINAKDAVYGFPSKIEDDPVMKLVITQHNEIDYAEERRLFYVALTRTKNRVYLIAPEKHPSEFVLEIKKEFKNIVLKGELNPEPRSLMTKNLCPQCGYPLQRRYKKGCSMNLWVCTNEPEVCGFLSNNLIGGRMSIQKCPDCLDGYLIVKTKNDYPFLGCTNYKSDGTGCNHTISLKDFELQGNDDSIIEIENIDENTDDEAVTVIDNPIDSHESEQSESVENNDDKTDLKEENDVYYFKDKDLNNLAVDLRRFAERQGEKENILFWKVLRKKAIMSLSQSRPLTIEDMRKSCSILGANKIKKYGDEIIKIIKDHVNKGVFNEIPKPTITVSNVKRKKKFFNDKLLNDLALELQEYAINHAEMENINVKLVLKESAIESICYNLPLTIDDFFEKRVLLGRREVEKYGQDIIKIVKKYTEIDNEANPIITKLNLKALDVCQRVISVCCDISRGGLKNIPTLVAVLKGKSTSKINTEIYQNVQHFGLLSQFNTHVIFNFIEYLVEEGIFIKNSHVDPFIRVNIPYYLNNLDVNRIVDIFEDENTEKIVKIDDSRYNINDYNKKLYLELVELRGKIALDKKCDFYIIATNELLKRLAFYMPVQRREFLAIKGIRDRWYNSYGQAFTEIIKKYRKEIYII